VPATSWPGKVSELIYIDKSQYTGKAMASRTTPRREVREMAHDCCDPNCCGDCCGDCC
jgi:hypothetical protein